MTLQLGIALTLVALSAAWFGRGFLRGLIHGECGGGCDGCEKGGCTLSKLEALKRELEAKRS
ncbi:MAG TPA: hypothetical protein VJ570_06375 [Holophagaceae bacterium]|nr:hypothetical protein [Holophagaceae bacterium]